MTRRVTHLMTRQTPRPFRSGFSIVEIAIAVAILTTVSIAVIGALIQSSRQIQATSDHTRALFLDNKVTEEMNQAAIENPLVHRTARGFTGQRFTIRDGSHPVFRALEDTVEPFGVLDPFEDGAIDDRLPTLETAYGSYGLTLDLDSSPTPPASGDPATWDLGIRYDWSARDRGPVEKVYAQVIADPRIRAGPSTDPATGARDTAILTYLEPDTTPSDLVAYARGTGADPQATRAVGGLVLDLDEVRRGLQTLDQALETRTRERDEALAAGTPATETRLALARLHETGAGLLWRGLLRIADTAEVPMPTAAVPPRLSVALEGILHETRTWRNRLDLEIHATIQEAREAYPDLVAGGVRAFRIMNLERRILEISQIQVLLATEPDVTFLRGWIRYLQQRTMGRNRYMAEYLVEQDLISQDAATLAAAYPRVATDAARLEVVEDQRTALLSGRD